LDELVKTASSHEEAYDRQSVSKSVVQV
jgi:hypothetical protein